MCARGVRTRPTALVQCEHAHAILSVSYRLDAYDVLVLPRFFSLFGFVSQHSIIMNLYCTSQSVDTTNILSSHLSLEDE